MQSQYYSNPQLLFWVALLQKIITVFLVLVMLLSVVIVNTRLQDDPVVIAVFTVCVMSFFIINLLAFVPVIALSCIVYRPFPGCLIGLICMVPCFGWLVQIVLLRECNNDQRQAGLNVGVFGAKLSEVQALIDQIQR